MVLYVLHLQHVPVRTPKSDYQIVICSIMHMSHATALSICVDATYSIFEPTTAIATPRCVLTLVSPINDGLVQRRLK